LKGQQQDRDKEEVFVEDITNQTKYEEEGDDTETTEVSPSTINKKGKP
jgi:hypothetical protein